MENFSLIGYIFQTIFMKFSTALQISKPQNSIICKSHLSVLGFDPWVRKIPWRGKWKPTPVFLSGKFHGQRSLTGYSPWGHKELDTTVGCDPHSQKL